MFSVYKFYGRNCGNELYRNLLCVRNFTLYHGSQWVNDYMLTVTALQGRMTCRKIMLMSTKKQSTIIYIFLAIYSFIFLSLCFNNNVWLDEAFTATLVRTDFAGVIARSMADTLPPLYNILLKLATDIFGYTIPVMKITSVVPMILTLALGATTVRKRFGFVTSFAFMTCITGMPLMLYYGIEIRMYSLGFFFATAAGIYAYEMLCEFNRKNCILFAVFGVLAGYSHHFAFVAVGFVYLFLLIYYICAARERIKEWFGALAVTIVLYLPCLLVTLKQFKSVSGYFSMPDITMPLFVQYVCYPFSTGNTLVSALLMVTVILLILTGIIRIVKRKETINEDIYAICCFVVYYGVLIFGTLICKIMTANIFVDRYLFFSTGLIWLAVAVALGRIPSSARGRYAKIAVFAVLFVTAITTYVIQFENEYKNDATDEIDFIRENFADNDIFYTVERHEELQFCIPFYCILGGAPDIRYEAVMDKALERYDTSPEGTLWIIVQEGYELSQDELAEIEKSGYAVEYVTTFDFDRYKCDIYKLK